MNAILEEVMDSPLAKAKAYVDTSNNHDLEAIAPMLAEGCRYISSGVGEYKGKQAILSMMETFFSANPDVHWAVSEYQLATETQVIFDFTISLGGTSSNGVEKISFDDNGHINLIEVLR